MSSHELRFYREHGAIEAIPSFDWPEDGEYPGIQTILIDGDTWVDPYLRGVVYGDAASVVVNIHPDDLRKVRLGLSWGLRTTETVGVWKRRKGYLPERPAPTAGSWHWTREPDMRKFLKEAVMEGLIEKAQVPIDHWAAECGVLESWSRLKQDASSGDEQAQADIETWINGKLPAAKTNRDRAMIEYIKLRREMETAFDGADTFAKTEAVCARWIKGVFGDDWYVRGFFKKVPNYPEYTAAEKFFAAEEQGDRLSRFAHANTPFPNDWLKNFFKSRPNLARMYGA